MSNWQDYVNNKYKKKDEKQSYAEHVQEKYGNASGAKEDAVKTAAPSAPKYVGWGSKAQPNSIKRTEAKRPSEFERRQTIRAAEDQYHSEAIRRLQQGMGEFQQEDRQTFGPMLKNAPQTYGGIPKNMMERALETLNPIPGLNADWRTRALDMADEAVRNRRDFYGEFSRPEEYAEYLKDKDEQAAEDALAAIRENRTIEVDGEQVPVDELRKRTEDMKASSMVFRTPEEEKAYNVKIWENERALDVNDRWAEREEEEQAKKNKAARQQAMLDAAKEVPYFADFDFERYQMAQPAANGDFVLRRMTDEERAVYRYFAINQGEEAANEYYEAMKPVVEQRELGKAAEELKTVGNEHPVLASALSAMMNVSQGIQGAGKVVYDVYKTATDPEYEIDPYDQAYHAGYMRDALREGAAQDMSPVGRFIYQTGMSVMDSTLGATLLGGTGGAALLASGAMTDTAKDAKLNDATNWQAIGLGGVAGLAELVTEKMGFNRLSDMIGGNRGNVFREILGHMASEFGEESATEIANILTDALIMTDKSEWMALAAEKGEKQALMEILGRVGLAGLGGALSGAAMGGGASAIGAIDQTVQRRGEQKAADLFGATDILSNGARGDQTVYSTTQELARLAQEAADAEMAEERGEAAPVQAAPMSRETISREVPAAPVRAEAAVSRDVSTAQRSMPETQVEQAARRIENEASKRQFVQAAEKYGEAATVFAHNYEGGDIATYDRAFNHLYSAGQTNLPLNRIREATDALTAGMSEGAKQAIWQAGRNADVKTIRPGVQQRTTVRLNDRQKRQFKMLDEMAKRYNYEIDIVDSIAGGMANGAYAGGRRIVVAADAAEGAIVQTGVHELVHALKANDAAGYGVLQDVVLKHLEGSENWLGIDYAVDTRIQEYAAGGVTLTREGAIEEIVAEAVPTFLTDEAAVKAFVRENRTLAEKVRDFFVKFAKEIREIAERYMQREGMDRDEIANLLGRSDALTEIAQTFDRAMEAAGEKEAAASGEVVFAGNKKYSPDRDRALMPGEMKNEFYEAMDRGEWHEYFQTLNGKKYNPDYYPDGKRATMKHNDKLLLMKMQRNGEFTVVAVYRNPTGWYNDDIDYMLDKWRRGKYGLDEVETWLSVIAADDGSGVFESYDRHSRRFVRLDGKENGISRGTVGVSGGRSAHGEGFREPAVGQTGTVREEGKFSLNSDAFRKWFGESKIVNEDGSPKVMYHGSEAAFTVFDKRKAKSGGHFGRGFYFTDSASHAGHYGNAYQVYLKIEHPLESGKSTVTKAQVKKFLKAVAANEDDYSIENYGTYDIDEILKTVYDKDTFSVIYDVNMTAIGDFVEAVKLFNQVNGTNFDGIIVPTETVVFEPNQIKSATDNVGTYDPENPDIRFSLNKPVEQVGELVALHNVDPEGLERSLNLGGIPAPSIAVVKSSSGHSKFGTVSLVFHKDSIDPEADARNRVYGYDAWTPDKHNARIEYEVNEEAKNRIDAALREYTAEIPALYRNGVMNFVSELDRKINNDYGFDGLIEDAAGNYGFMAAYLASAGDQVEMERTTRTEGGISEEARAKLEAVAAIFDHNDEYISKTPMSKIVEEYGDQIAEAMPGPFAWTKERYMRVLQRVSKYLRGELDGRTVEVDDVEATNRKIDAAINEEDFEKWLRELFDGVQGRAGIAREVDPYDRRGNRKSFAQTHYEVTAENIVRALYENAERKGANFMGASAEGIAAVASKEYKNINAIRKDKGRLYTEDAEAHYARYQKLDDELNAIMDDVRSVNPYADMDAAATAIINAAQDGSRTAAAIVRSFKKNGLTIDKGIGERIAAMYKEASEFPTGYFEAKPERVVGFDEVRAAIVPDSMDENIRKQLNAAVENVIVYPDGDETARLNALNGLEGVRFSLNNTAHARFDTASEAEKAAKAMRDGYINSDAFKKWFDGSVVTEPDGTPKIMYHGTSRSGFTLFDTYGSNYGLMGMGSYFTENTNIADSYTHKGKGNTPGVYAVYLKIDNPIDMDAVADNRMIDAWNEYFSDYLEGGEIRYGMTNEEALRVVEAAMQSEMIDKWEAIETVQGFYESQGYDGVTHIGGGRVNANGPKHRVYIAFDPTQIKSATANSGNFEPDHGDIRFSLNNTAPIESVMADDQNLMLPADVDVREESIKGVAASALSRGISERMDQQITGVANKILKETGSTYAKADIIANMKSLIDEYAANGATEETLRAVAEMAKKIIESSSRADNTLREQYADIRKKLRETGISLTETQKQEAANEAGSYNAYRQSLMGTVKLTNDGISLDAIWGELSSQNPEIFPADTGEAEMVGKLTDFMMLMKPKYENPYGMDMDGAALEMAMRIQADLMGILGARDAAKAMYGTAEKFRKQYEAEFKVKLAQQKKERVEKFQQIAAELKTAKAKGDSAEQAKIMNRYRAALKATALDEAYAEVRATYKEREAQKAENRKANELRGRVVKRAEELEEMFRRQEKGKRIPTGLQGLVLDALDMLDINGEHAAAAGKETKKAAEFREKLTGIRSFYEQVINSQSKGEAPEGMDGLMMAFTERNMAAMNEALDILGGGDKFRLRDMNSEQLKMLGDLLKNIKHTVDSVGKLWKIHRYQSVVELGNASIEEMDERGQQKIDAGSTAGKARDFLALDMLEPVSYGERLGEGGSVIIQGLMDGEKIKFGKIRDAAEATGKMLKDTKVTGYDIGKWRRNVRTVKLGSGRVVKMSDVNIMELYLTAKRPQGLQHLLANGMKIQSKEAGQQPRHIELTQADITDISGMLSEKQKKIADLMQAYLSGEAAKWGNDVTQRLYLYDAFTEQTYWPISSDPNSLKTQEPEADRAFTAITNAGFTKPLNVKATNPIIIGDAFETFGRHIGEMASYAGYAEVMTDTLAWINYRQRSDDGKLSGSVKESIETLLGNGGIKYLTKLVQDINGARRGGDNTQFSGVFGKLTSNAKKAAVAGKIRVAIQQWTSIVRAAMEINPRFLISKLGAGKKTIAEMQQWSSLAWWKSNGNYEIGIGKSTDQIFWGDTSRLDPAIENTAKVFALGLDPGKMDDMTWAQMWTAVKSETKHTRKDLKVGSDEYFRAVAERFEYIMDRTQVVDTVMHRSDLMRSKDGATKALTAFMGEPTKSYNMLARAIMNAGRNPKDPKAYGKVARAYTVYAASAAAVVAMTALFDSLKYRDDDEEFWEYFGKGMWFKKWGERWRDNILDAINPFNDIPIVSQVLDIINGGDVPTIMALDGVEDAVKAVKTTINYFVEDNTGKYSAYGVFKALATAGSTITGLPVNGMLANMEMLTHAYDPELLQTKSNMASTEQAFEKLYDAVLSGDRSKELEIRTELAKGMYGKAPKSVKEIDAGISDQLAISDERILKAWQMKNTGKDTKGLVALYKEIQKDGFTDEMIKRAVNNAQSKYQAEYDALIEDEKPNEAQALLEKCAKYGMNLEKEKEPKDLEAELKATTYTDKELFRIIRNGDLTDIAAAAEIKIAESDAKKPEETVRSAVSGEFREEYVELVKAGKTRQAEELAGKLAIFDLDDGDLLEWVKDDYRSNLKKAIEKGDMKESERLIETMRDEYGLDDESIASTVRNRFKQDYIDLVMAGKDREADELAEKLMDLGLKYADGNNRFKQANLNKWVLDWEKAQEDSE